MQSKVRRLAKKAARSAGELKVVDVPPREDEPSEPSTKKATTLTSHTLRGRSVSVLCSTFLYMIIDCGSCVMAEIACSDCVVATLLELTPANAVTAEVSDGTVEAICLLSSRGIVRPLRFSTAIHG